MTIRDRVFPTVRNVRHFSIGLAAIVVSAAYAQAPPADLVTLFLKATEFDPTFQSARSERQLTVEALRESKSGALPTISANVVESQVAQNIKSSETPLWTVGRSDYFTQDLAISLTQPVFRSTAFHRIPEARAGVRRGDAELAAAEQDLILRVSEAVFNFLAFRDDVAFTTAEREAIGRQLDETEQKLGSGLARLTDVHEARGRFAVSQAAEIDAKDRLEDARQALAEITGEAPSELKVLSQGLPVVRPESQDVETWLQTALFQNPKILAATAAVDMAREELKAQRGAYKPSLDFVASYSDNDAGGTVYGGGNNIANRQLALRLAVPIYDGGRTPSQVASAALRQNIAAQALERETRSAERQTRTAFQGVMSGVARVEALAVSVLANEATVVGKEEGWRAGLNTGLAVLDARKDLYSAKRDHARARYLYLLSALKLKQAAGSLSLRDLQEINAYLQ
jgi:outer membrane protein